MNEALRRRLLAMEQQERDLHTELSQTGEMFGRYPQRMSELNHRQALELAAIVEEHGWPGRSLVGNDGSHAAWFTLQHALPDPGIMRRLLPILKDAIARGDAAPAQAAYVEDRISFMEGRPQRYGTIFDWDEKGRLSPWRLEDPERVDEFRQSVGLPPLRKKQEQFCNETGPADYREVQEWWRQWAKSAGW
jgi:hypothetical protein